jgi:hypothetical protein
VFLQESRVDVETFLSKAAEKGRVSRRPFGLRPKDSGIGDRSRICANDFLLDNVVEHEFVDHQAQLGGEPHQSVFRVRRCNLNVSPDLDFVVLEVAEVVGGGGQFEAHRGEDGAKLIADHCHLRQWCVMCCDVYVVSLGMCFVLKVAGMVFRLQVAVMAWRFGLAGCRRLVSITSRKSEGKPLRRALTILGCHVLDMTVSEYDEWLTDLHFCIHYTNDQVMRSYRRQG